MAWIRVSASVDLEGATFGMGRAEILAFLHALNHASWADEIDAGVGQAVSDLIAKALPNCGGQAVEEFDSAALEIGG